MKMQFVGVVHPPPGAPFVARDGGNPPLQIKFSGAAHPPTLPYKWRPFVGTGEEVTRPYK